MVFLFSVACKQKPKTEYRRYEITGRVVSVDHKAGQVILAHEEIPGFMKAMTMGFKIKEQWALDRMEPGDRVSGVLVVDPEGGYIENPVITKGGGTQPEASTSSIRDPQVGDKVPDFPLVNQAGKRVSLGQFAGRPLMLTFIYSRCPLPDYCIRMSNNFAETAKLLKDDPAAYAKLQMLSVSIDPEYDRPEVLRKYAKTYAGEVDPKLEHWTFATGTPEQVKKVADFFGLAYEPQSGQIIHSLRTAILDKEGKIAFIYRGNDWRPADAVRDLKSLL
jgi:protein SCO1/2